LQSIHRKGKTMSNKKKRRHLQGLIIIWLIFLPFLVFGIFLLGLAGDMIHSHLRALSWQPVTATLLERYTEQGSRKSNTSRQIGKFSYVWQDQLHESTKLSFSRMYAHGGGAGIDDWDKRLAATTGNVGQQFSARVNPANPTEAVALPDVRWTEMALYLGFGLLSTWAGYTFLFAMNQKHQATQKPGFSWRAVAIMAAFGLPLLVLAPLLWRDQHGIWAVLVCLPSLLALHGVVHGLRLKQSGH
jgi:Protein of unknown function (DUF3592)